MMGEADVTRAELARRMGRTRGFVTHLLSGDRNLTLGTLAEIAEALGCKVAYRASFTLISVRDAIAAVGPAMAAFDGNRRSARLRSRRGTRMRHTAVADEHITVLQGPWYLGLGESFDTSRLKALPTGSFVIIPAGTPHFVSTENEAIIQAHGVGVVSITFVSTKRERH